VTINCSWNRKKADVIDFRIQGFLSIFFVNKHKKKIVNRVIRIRSGPFFERQGQVKKRTFNPNDIYLLFFLQLSAGPIS
jgi:hypothetical protein